MSLDLSTLTQKEASLVQLGLKAAGVYHGTTNGNPGPKTRAALQAYLNPLQQLAPEGNSIPARMVELAQKEVGVVEVPKNSNRGKRVQEYQRATWLDGTGWAWCAAFICWLAKEAGMTKGRPQTAGAWDFERWARKTSGVELIKPAPADIRPGDIVIFKFSHIGLAVAKPSGSTVKTIEGNTDAKGSREGGGVYRKTRRLSKIRSIVRINA